MIHKTTVSVAEHVNLVSYDYSVLPLELMIRQNTRHLSYLQV